MDKKIAALLGAAAGLATLGSAQAATPATPNAASDVQSYADLLTPVPNAMAQLKAEDAAQAPQVELAQYHHHHHHYRRYRHHHHHSRWWYRHHRYHHHHHHHHHHHGAFIGIPGVGGVVVHDH